MPTFEETRTGTYTEPFTQEQWGVFTTTKDGEIKFVTTCVSADSALMKAALYYHDMNKNPKNNMDMSEIERFFVRVRVLTFSTWSTAATPAKRVVKKNNPWYEFGGHWND